LVNTTGWFGIGLPPSVSVAAYALTIVIGVCGEADVSVSLILFEAAAAGDGTAITINMPKTIASRHARIAMYNELPFARFEAGQGGPAWLRRHGGPGRSAVADQFERMQLRHLKTIV
jgi:hypothetical protein